MFLLRSSFPLVLSGLFSFSISERLLSIRTLKSFPILSKHINSKRDHSQSEAKTHLSNVSYLFRQKPEMILLQTKFHFSLGQRQLLQCN